VYGWLDCVWLLVDVDATTLEDKQSSSSTHAQFLFIFCVGRFGLCFLPFVSLSSLKFKTHTHTHTHTGYIFPALIAALVPFRAYVISYFFTDADLVYLDPLDEAFTPPSSSIISNSTNTRSNDPLKSKPTMAAMPFVVDSFENGLEDKTNHGGGGGDDKALSG
jgi:hypothetical protein